MNRMVSKAASPEISPFRSWKRRSLTKTLSWAAAEGWRQGMTGRAKRKAEARARIGRPACLMGRLQRGKGVWQPTFSGGEIVEYLDARADAQ
jgi:hypothetical protein